MEVVRRTVLEKGEVLDIEIVELKRHAEVGGLDSHGSLLPSNRAA
jgi:hypothetical protein